MKSIGHPRLGHKSTVDFSLLSPGSLRGSQLSCCEETQTTLWEDPCGQQQASGLEIKPSWKQILQPRSILQVPWLTS